MPTPFVTAGDVATAGEYNMLPRGVVATDTTTTAGANAGDVGILSAPSFTAVAGRRYKITATWYNATIVGTGNTDVWIRRGSGGTRIAGIYVGSAGALYPGNSLCVTDVPGAGSVAYVLNTNTDATTVQLGSGATLPISIIVEDIGAS